MTSTAIDRSKVKALMRSEQQLFAERHPRSLALYHRAQNSLLAGVPMHWMTRWPGGFPLFVAEAKGATFRDVDGLEYIDLCLGDTGAMTGHSPEAALPGIIKQLHRGITTMLPSENAFWVAEELQRRFGLKYWQFALSATDANRFSLRLARAITGRPKVLVFHGCYHGTVDEAYAWLVDGKPASRPGNIGPQVDPTLTTKVVEWNDVEALEEALRPGDVAAVLAEPVMTNVGIVQPQPGYHTALRELTRRYGTLLILDETHTLSAGPGGYTKAHGLEPDLLTVGKPLGSGIPSAAYGFTEEVGRKAQSVIQPPYADTGGIGGTLAANALSLAAMRATLEHVLTEEAYARMIALGEQLEAEVRGVMEQYRLPWHVTRVGCRVEYLFRPNPAQNGSEALAGQDPDLDPFIHLFMLNRGILLTPFHNMTLISPETTPEQVRRHTEVFEEAVQALLSA
ncbi:MAG: aspartate aminotransferase family protein [Meiothermus sp.]|uniref:aspartate aminotransferase family protein n=1 Tax=Meiothermus sp. TaxID=1955249 RepID=UPI0025E3F8E8|nr:aspartate aminotransferase family protein [Meiothermus sp.]MCS7067708.1 aspartate aminotransferase family protein [Meiothermus sp.]MDW8426008.1 aspartate aminotransferase family protein [Meiothermus sp.]